jgi:GNAT superfamily N-acetyltransferase
MGELEFSIVDPDQIDRTLGTLVSAFADDPVERWLWPPAEDYEAHFPSLLRAMGDSAFQYQTVWRLGDFAAVALWFPPMASPDGERIVETLINSVAPEKHNEVFQVLEQMDASHPKFPHWYLPWFGVESRQQGNGIGGQLLKLCLENVDAEGLPAYLESPNTRNLSFYEWHGFKVVGEARTGACPPVTFMLRPARD